MLRLTRGPARAAALGSAFWLALYGGVPGLRDPNALAAEDHARDPSAAAKAGGRTDNVKKIPLVIAHRGASYAAAENTLPAFDLAWAENADAVELDIHLTRDKRIVVYHNDRVDIGGKALPVNSRTLSELNAVVVRKTRGKQVVQGTIPGLEEVLAAVPKGKQVFVEIKSTDNTIVAVLDKVLAASGKDAGQIVLISFKATILRQAKQIMPQYRAFLLAAIKEDKKTGARIPDLDDLIRTARDAQFDGLDLSGPLTEDWGIERTRRALSFTSGRSTAEMRLES